MPTADGRRGLSSPRPPPAAGAHGQNRSPSPGSPPPLQVSRRAVAPTPAARGDVRPLDRAPAPPLQAAPGARDSAVEAGPTVGHAGCDRQRGRRGSGLGCRGGPMPGRGASRRSSGLWPRAHLPGRPHSQSRCGVRTHCPAGSRDALPVSAVHLCPSQPITHDCPGRTSRNL